MTQPLEREVVEPRMFSLASSPVYRVLRRLHLLNAAGRPYVLRIVAIAWLPLCIAGLTRLAYLEMPAPILLDISVHVRLLVAIPLLLKAEDLLDQRCRGAIKQLYEGRLAPGASLDHIITRAERARDSRAAELLIGCIVLAMGVAGVTHVIGPTGVVAGVSEPQAVTFARVWYVLVSLPIVQFLIVRWLWHWCIWSYIVIRVSRLPLHMNASHPDHAGGIGFLSSPVTSFAGYVLALAATLSGAWGTQILDGHATLQSFVPTFILFVVVVLVVACAPLLGYTSHLYQARHRDIGANNRLALEFVRAFYGRWIDKLGKADDLAQWPDYTRLTDMGGSYESLVKIRLVPIGPRSVLSIWAAAVAPMLPLVATTMPLDKLLLDIGHALLGGLPA
jgi:hypothetical protein